MKINVMLGVLCSLALLGGCGNSSRISLTDIPDVSGQWVGVGSSTLRIASDFDKLQQATDNARSDLARQIQTELDDQRVRRVENDQSANDVGAYREDARERNTTVSRYVTQLVLREARRVKVWENPDTGAYYAWVQIDEDSLPQYRRDHEVIENDEPAIADAD